VPVEVTTNKAGPYLRAPDELVPTALHVTEHGLLHASIPATPIGAG
jgi:hypothetical protein